MIIVGIDFSLAETGVSILGKDGTSLFLGSVKSKQEGKLDIVRFDEHANNIFNKINDVVVLKGKEHNLGKTLFILEEYAFSANGMITRIAEGCGLMKNFLYDKGFATPRNILFCHTTTLKKFVSGTGKAKKDLMLLSAYKRWGISSTNDNEVDAFGLSKVGEALLKDKDSLLQYERECVETVLNYNSKFQGDMTWLCPHFSAKIKKAKVTKRSLLQKSEEFALNEKEPEKKSLKKMLRKKK